MKAAPRHEKRSMPAEPLCCFKSRSSFDTMKRAKQKDCHE